MPWLGHETSARIVPWSKVSFPSGYPRWGTGRFVRSASVSISPCRWVRCELLPLRDTLLVHVRPHVKRAGHTRHTTRRPGASPQTRRRAVRGVEPRRLSIHSGASGISRPLSLKRRTRLTACCSVTAPPAGNVCPTPGLSGRRLTVRHSTGSQGPCPARFWDGVRSPVIGEAYVARARGCPSRAQPTLARHRELTRPRRANLASRDRVVRAPRVVLSRAA
jgi:hypothetical protein